MSIYQEVLTPKMCIKKVQDIQAGIKGIENIPKAIKIVDNGEKLKYKEDTLAVTTYYTRLIFSAVYNFYKWFQGSDYYKVLFGTTQPAHLILALAILSVAFLYYPNDKKLNFSPLWMFLYLASFSIHFGTQIWMTFVSGLSLYFNIPRHTFGDIQTVLFPRYFLINAMLSFITLSIFLMVKNAQLFEPSIAIQALVLTICFIIELSIRLYFTTPLLHLICIKTQLEKAAGIGMEIGRLNVGTLMDCPYYLKIHRTFRRTHITIAIGNMVSMACTVMHLFYLSQRLCNL